VTRPERRTITAYIVANLWEIAISLAFAISAIGNLLTHNNRTTITAVWGYPWDTLIVAFSGIAGASVFLGLVFWLPRVRAAGLMLLASMLIVLTISAIHVRGLPAASYGAAAYIALASAAIGRAASIAAQGDFPPGRRVGDYPRATP
jgi:hypothetical protein